MAEKDKVAERRDQGDRREGQQGQGRRGDTKRPSGLLYVLRAVGLVVVLVAVIVYTVANTRPIYSTSGTLGDELRKRAPGMAGVIAPNDSTHVDQLMATAKFQAEKRNFFEDVMRLKQVDSARADSIAQFAVREAYVRGISPAIIFGVMLTENARFISKATSNVGAVGLMQVYPKVWLTKEMSALFGKDIATDSTNVTYGVFLLRQYFRPRTKSGQTTDRDWQTALLRYNGCVKGTNTPRCHTYPDKVQRFVEGSAKSICDGRGFYECIGKPFIAGLFGKTNGTQQPGTTSNVSTGSVATPAAAAPATAPVLAPQPAAPGTTRPFSAPTVTPRPAVAAPAAHASTAKATSRKTSPRKPGAKPAPAKASAKKKAVQPKGKTRTTKSTAPLKVPKRINVIIPTP
ncbi:hypothetical protein BH11GEM1_BH11GEM1_09500 [soil metagenome]